MKLDDLDDQLGLDLKSEDYDSVGGYIIGLLDHLPQAGEEVVSGNLKFVVDTVERNRIDKVHLYILDETKENEESRENKDRMQPGDTLGDGKKHDGAKKI